MAVKEQRGYWKVDAPIVTRNLVILPVCNGHMGGEEWVTLGEALGKGIAQLLETGDVNRVTVVTPPEPFVVIDGEEIGGAFQDRMFVTSFFTREQKRVEAPVACVEAGRWSGSRTFKTSGYVAPPSVRATTQASLYRTRTREKTPSVNQEAVWERVHFVLASTNSLEAAPTQSMRAGQEALKHRSREYRVATLLPKPKREYSNKVARWLDEIPLLANQVGAIFFASGHFLGMDVMPRSLFSRMYDGLLESAATEALALLPSETPTQINALEDRVNEVLKFALSFRRWCPYPATGDGREMRRYSKKYVGKVLLNGEDVVHLSVHPRLEMPLLVGE